MAGIENGVYWCARDLAGLAVVGNHHFILLVADKSNFEKDLNLVSEEEDDVFFYTFAGTKSDEDRLVFSANQEHDVKSVREVIDPDEHTSLLEPDLDMEHHKVTPPVGSEIEFMKQVAELACNYEASTRVEAPKYSLIDENCAAWVNTLFSVAGLSDESREELGEFFGIDWGEEDLIERSLFTTP